MVSTVTLIDCDKCGEKAEVWGMDLGPDREPELGAGRDNHETSGAFHVIDCPNCGIRTQAVAPQGTNLLPWHDDRWSWPFSATRRCAGDHINQRNYVPLQVSDVVRTDMGLKGIVVSLTDDGLAAFIETVEIGRFATVDRYRLDRLTKVSEHEAGAV
jgi:hypothetical protein